jgi:hypothetical protein
MILWLGPGGGLNEAKDAVRKDALKKKKEESAKRKRKQEVKQAPRQALRTAVGAAD